MRRRRVRGAAVVVAILLPLAGCGQLFGPKATLGPGAIVRGRGLYNDVISETNNEQTLELIVRARYGEPAAMMSVASVTAGLHAGTTTEAQFGFGAPSNYKGNIVPLSVGVAYEENPTISYVPVQGERYAKSLLTPIGLDVLLLLLGIENGPAQSISMLVKHVNGLDNAMYGPPEKRAAFRASIALLGSLQDDGLATWTASPTEPGGFALVIHDYAPAHRDAVRALLRAWNIADDSMRGDRDVVLPVKLGVGLPRQPGLNVQTRSVYDLIQIAATAVEAPAEHTERGIVEEQHGRKDPLEGSFHVYSARTRPPTEVLVAVRHHGYWFWIAANDHSSKTVFRMLQALIGMRLVEAMPQAVPALTIPVGK